MEMNREKRDTIISSLYERCSNGEISVSQRETLIQKTNSMFFATETQKQNISTKSIVEESVESSIEECEISPMEKYNLFKESVYEKCAKGEISITVREELLAKARDKFLNFSE